MLRGRRLVRSGAVKDHLTLFDPGMFIITAEGASDAGAGTQYGVIEVHYTIKFYNYHLSGTSDFAPHQLSVRRASGQTLTGSSTYDAIDFDDPAEAGGLGETYSSNLFTMPRGMYKLTFNCELYLTNDTVDNVHSCVGQLLKNSVAVDNFHSTFYCSVASGDDAITWQMVAVVECDDGDTLSWQIKDSDATSPADIRAGNILVIEALN